MDSGADSDLAATSAAPAPDLRVSLGLGLASFLIAAALAAVRIGRGAPDFYVFWSAARHWRAPYDPAVIARLEAMIHLHGTWPFAYPPTFLLIVYPFTLLPLTLAYPLWTGLSSGLFVGAASRLVRPAWAAVALLAAPPVFFAGELGQTTLVVGAAMIGGWLALERRPALAGVLFALAACIKPQAMILAPLVLWGRWRTLGWMLGAGLTLVAASLVFGPSRWLEWPRALSAFAAIAPGADRANPSALIAGPWWAALAAALGIVFAWRNRNLAGMVAGAFCLTPYAHDYDLAPLAPLAATWLLQPRTHGWGRAATGAALLAGLVATPAAGLAFVVSLAAFPWRGRPLTSPLPVAGERATEGSASAAKAHPLPRLLSIPLPTPVGRGEVRGGR